MRALTDGRPTVLFTSPPYGAAQKYVRSSSLELAWLGALNGNGTIELERRSIGREHVRAQELTDPNLGELVEEFGLREVHERAPARAYIYAKYFDEMRQAIHANTDAPTTVTGVVLVAAPNVVGGLVVPTHQILASMIRRGGFELLTVLKDEIRGRTLMTKRRSGNPATSEYVYVFKRGG